MMNRTTNVQMTVTRQGWPRIELGIKD